MRASCPSLGVASIALVIGCAAPAAEPTTVPPTVAPDPSPIAATATAEPAAIPTMLPGTSADDPPDLPRVPGARLVSHEAERDDGLDTVELEYRVDQTVDVVRQHYRRVMRELGWNVGDIEVHEDGWELKASRGLREVTIEIERDGDATLVEVVISEPIDRGR